MARIWHYDGTSALRHEGELVAEAGQFRLRIDEVLGEPVPWDVVTLIGEKDGVASFGHKAKRGWRLGFDGVIPPEIAVRLPKAVKYGRWIDRVGLWPAAGLGVALSGAALFVGIQAPDWLAPLVPQSLERKLGDAMVGDFGGRVCNGPGGQEALNVMVKRVEPESADLKVRVVNINMVNAVALPGGNILVFRGLLQEAKSPDELAGVIGHEIGHVRNRDVMQSLLRQMGLSILLGGANSDLGGSINTIVSSTYSRAAETNADGYSIRAMQRAQVSPLATAQFFARLAEIEKSLGKAKSALGYLASHPLSETREKAFRESQAKNAQLSPSLTPQQWRALVDSCKNDPDVEQDDGFLF